MNGDSVRPAAVAGAFYPDDADELRREVKGLLDAVPGGSLAGEVAGIIVPHAGYRYSAAVAASGYKVLQGAKADTVVVIGHDAHARGLIALLSGADAFENPLGRVAVDTEMVNALTKAHRGIQIHDSAHRRDHTVEVQLPFLQEVLPGCRLVPVLFGEPTPEHCRAFAQALAQAAGTRRLLIAASTDLAHYPRHDLGAVLNRQTMAQVTKLEVDGLFAYLNEAERRYAGDGVQTAMCASGGVGTLLAYAKARGTPSAQLLQTATSGDVPAGDRSRVVGYAAAVVRIEAKAATAAATAATAVPEAPGEATPFSLAPDVQKELLGLARRRIVTAARKEPFSYSPPEAMAEALSQRAPVFVTLHKDQRLRGCIGMTAPRGELWCAVRDMAMAAAFEDRRFDPVQEDELPALHIEISVLSPLRSVSGPDDIVPKRDGVVVRRQGRSGLFLPQVWEQLPGKERFLGVLCAQKAGLPEDAWKDPGTQLLTFTVFAFEEP